MTEKLKNILISIFSVVITGVLCSYFTRTGVKGWFAELPLMGYMPPNYIFSLAWSIIYILLIVSFYRILNADAAHKGHAMRLYWQQLMLQVLWCIVFFACRQPLIGGLIILWLIWTVYKMIRAFLKIDQIAGALNYFYFAYICFAAFLNFAFMFSNGVGLNI